MNLGELGPRYSTQVEEWGGSEEVFVIWSWRMTRRLRRNRQSGARADHHFQEIRNRCPFRVEEMHIGSRDRSPWGFARSLPADTFPDEDRRARKAACR
jgi:hypothetical protein